MPSRAAPGCYSRESFSITSARMGERLPVRRRLNFDWDDGFRDGSGDNFINTLQEEARRDNEEAKIRWNFDFEHEMPLPGRWQWERVEPETETVPATVQPSQQPEPPREEGEESQQAKEGAEEEEEEEDQPQK
ncbi:uncharacterized protein [Periplaneta americana]|uniref:uncharacterized protein n=1 Tax=Periplaneta americana TaxID=6978 RepID=UPI0037E91384